MLPVAGQPQKGTLVTDSFTSVVLRENKLALGLNRKVKIYLPPGYTASGKAYPVVYYCHSIFGNPGSIFGAATDQVDRAVAAGVTRAFILVVADYSSPTSGSMYENSPVSGKWLDFTVQELVPFVDRKYRTIRHQNSRAITGDFMGGRGALKLAMTYPDVFSVVYALHPVATGVGTRPWTELGVNWTKINKATTYAELAGDTPSQIFVSICQAFLPNPSRPPFYCDFFMEPDSSGGVKVNTPHMIHVQHDFMLEGQLAESAGNLKKLRAIAFDWARYDGNFDHVYANRAFTRDLEDLGIEHEAEEYRGRPWNKTWNDDGRFYTRVLPFLNRNLVFEQ
ncbi:putative esterase [Flavihumibacter petaseus NBRC 106054]|uniref:Putative esterase n=2 Tax=Flavihumibacter TaxID=1004301 RepID=A0A0E9N1G9_9BACT|nr:putative esterase [Flavihumibacter petaseus NBRC 106054]